VIFDGPDKFLSAHVQDVSGVVAVARARSAGHPREQIPGRLPGAFVCSSVGLRLSYAHTAWHDAGGVTGKSLSCPLWLPLDAGDWCGGSSGPLYVQEVAGGWASVPGVLHA